MAKKNYSNNVRAHSPYKAADGTALPGVTTIIGQLDKPALIHWAWKLGMDGIDYQKQKGEAASIGTLVHQMIMLDLRGDKAEGAYNAELSPQIIDLAENSFISYLAWRKGKDINPIYVEQPKIEEGLRFGGCPDFVGHIEGVQGIWDFKTGGGLYPEHFYQLAGYALLYPDIPLNKFELVRIGKTADEGFDTAYRTNLDVEKRIFLALLEIYWLKKQSGKTIKEKVKWKTLPRWSLKHVES